MSPYIQLASKGQGNDQSWLVGVMNGTFCMTSFLVFTYPYMCFCLYTIKLNKS